MHLLAWAAQAGARSFVLASTGGLYRTSEQPIGEEAPVVIEPGPLGFYFATKRASELLASQFGERFTVTILRCFFLYGSGQSPAMLMPRLVSPGRLGLPIQLQGGNGDRRHPIHAVADVRAL